MRQNKSFFVSFYLDAQPARVFMVNTNHGETHMTAYTITIGHYRLPRSEYYAFVGDLAGARAHAHKMARDGGHFAAQGWIMGISEDGRHGGEFVASREIRRGSKWHIQPCAA